MRCDHPQMGKEHGKKSRTNIANIAHSRAALDVVQTAFCVFGFINWGGEDG